MSEPLVSVGMPVYNGARFLGEALDSIRAQTHRNLDIVISDNGSTDATPELCRMAAAVDSRIRYFRQEMVLSANDNFHFVREQRRGAYFLWAAHDDVREPDFVAETLGMLAADPRLVLAHSRTILIDASGAEEGTLALYGEAIAGDDPAARVAAFVRERNNVAFYGLMPERVVASMPKVGPSLTSDIEFVLGLAVRGPIGISPRPLFRYRTISQDRDYARAFGREAPGDYVLARWKAFAATLRDAPLAPRERDRALDALRRELRPMLDERASWLIGELLRAAEPSRLSTLLTYARQYPPLVRSRLFLGALRRLLTGGAR